MADIAALRAKQRQQSIPRLLYQVWPKPLGLTLIAEALAPDEACSVDDLARALAYLHDRGLIRSQPERAHAAPIYCLTADGVDAVETAAAQTDPTRTHHTRMLRLRVLQALSWGAPAPMGEGLISTALATDTDLDLSGPSIRRALTYLVERHLAVDRGAGMFGLTADGTDYLAGDGAGVAGIARPVDW